MLGILMTVCISDLSGASLVDSLKSRLVPEKNDSVRYEWLTKISQEYMLTDLQNAVEYARMARMAAISSKSETLISESLYNSGMVFFNHGLLDSATLYFNGFLDKVREQGASVKLAIAYSSLGVVYQRLKDFGSARKYYKMSLEQLDQLEPVTQSEPDATRAALYNNMGLIAKEEKQYSEAMKNFRLGLSVARRISEAASLEAMLYNNLGIVFHAIEVPDSAFIYYKKALDLRVKISDKAGMAASYRNVGAYYDKLDQREKALFYYQQSFQAAKEVSSLTQMKFTAELLYEFYDKVRIPDSALKYLELVTHIKSKERETTAASELARREMLQDFLEKERSRQKRLSMVRTVAIVLFSVLILVLATVLYRFISAKRKIRLKMEEAELLSNAAEQIQNENEQIRSEYDKMNRYLAVTSLKTLQKENLIAQLAEKIIHYPGSVNDQTSTEIGHLIRSLDKAHEKLVWKEFEYHFLQVNPKFYERLNSINPGLTANDRRLCAFLKIGLSTKEIADITGRTLESLHKSRMRLRQKLNITNSHTRITDFLNTM